MLFCFAFSPRMKFSSRLPSAAGVLQYSRIKAIRGVDEVVNQRRLLPVERLHFLAAAVVLDPLQHQAHDVDAAAETRTVSRLTQSTAKWEPAAG